MDIQKIKDIYNQTSDRIKNVHIGCFEGMAEPLFLISDTYPGVWLEHVYDAVFYAKHYPEYTDIAVNTLNLFIDRQTREGQLPCYVMNSAKCSTRTAYTGFTQIQECVSFGRLCHEVCEMKKDNAFLEKCYNSIKRWDAWLRKYRMTTGRGLVEMFVGFDTGHDNSGRLDGIKFHGLRTEDGFRLPAHIPPANDPACPILAVDMNCNFYGTQTALADMARMLGKNDEAAEWDKKAHAVKEKIFELLYDKEDAFFYDVDKNGNKRKFRSSTIFHLFIEKVLDKDADREIIDEIYDRHINNPDEFRTPYPFPAMAINDPSCENHAPHNCWGYYSQGLIALRCTRWMDHYGWSKDFDMLCEKWVQAWTDCFDELKMGQELDPITGKPTKCSQWYSSCMLFYTYAAKRLGLIKEEL